MTTASAHALEQGTFIVAEFIKTETVTKQGRTGEFKREAVKVLIDSQYPRTIEYPEGQLPAIVQAAERGDVIALSVYPKVSGDRVYWQGGVRD